MTENQKRAFSKLMRHIDRCDRCEDSADCKTYDKLVAEQKAAA